MDEDITHKLRRKRAVGPRGEDYGTDLDCVAAAKLIAKLRGKVAMQPDRPAGDVERVARAIFEKSGSPWSWGNSSEGTHHYFREMARAAITAMQPAQETK